MKNKITFTVQWIGGDRYFVTHENNENGSGGSSVWPISLEEVMKKIKDEVEESVSCTM